MKELRQLADFVAALTYDSLPPAVVARAQMVIRDTIGVIIGGMAEPDVSALADYAVGAAPGRVRLLGHGGGVTAPWAALVHGTAGTTLEMDEGHAFARGHAAIHALPPALALAADRGAAGATLIAAFVAGYEVAARVGVATRLRPQVHPFGAWGVLGAATAAAWFAGASGPALAETLELAASYAINPSFDTAFQGANGRNTYAGIVNRLGMLAADLHALGFRGERGGVRTTFGHLLGERFDAAALSDALGERYEIMRGYAKPYSGCRYTHAAIDAVFQLRAAGAIDPEAIAAIDVATYDIAARLVEPRPRTPLAGRFSTPYVVAATLLRGSAGPEIFTAAALADETILSLASRVRVREDPTLTAMTPARRPAQITLHFHDGSRRHAAVTGSKGDPDQPLTATELEAKFIHLTRPVLGADGARAGWDRWSRLEQETDVSALIAQRLSAS